MNSKVDYLNNPWKPVKHSIIKDAWLKQQIHEVGYVVLDFASDEQIDNLSELYESEHSIPNQDGGMFYSLYSSKIDYRYRVNDAISRILKPSINNLFENYKEVIHSFIAKFPGPKSELSLHQDTTGLDEFKYSPLSIWLPLEDVNEENGCLCVIPKSHHFFSPYRGISFPDPFDGIRENLGKYLVPIQVKKGQAIIFDPRVLHNSKANVADSPRIVSLSGLFPKEADFVHCYMYMGKDNTELEFYKQDEAFLIEYPYLLVNCTERPTIGEIIDRRPHSVDFISMDQFNALCRKFEVQPYSELAVELRDDCFMIGEPT